MWELLLITQHLCTHGPNRVHKSVTCSSLLPACPRAPHHRTGQAPRLSGVCAPGKEEEGLAWKGDGCGGKNMWVRHTGFRAWLSPAWGVLGAGKTGDLFLLFSYL